MSRWKSIVAAEAAGRAPAKRDRTASPMRGRCNIFPISLGRMASRLGSGRRLEANHGGTAPLALVNHPILPTRSRGGQGFGPGGFRLDKAVASRAKPGRCEASVRGGVGSRVPRERVNPGCNESLDASPLFCLVLFRFVAWHTHALGKTHQPSTTDAFSPQLAHPSPARARFCLPPRRVGVSLQ